MDVTESAEADVDASAAAARQAFKDRQGWSRWEPASRAEATHRLATQLARCRGHHEEDHAHDPDGVS
ncbi:hypothetical protein ACFY78_11350 [Streptomyces olindensis]|uniref:hypothetical protein n=1 Tax=Streptomyces olindensis TaxID=358823 RepID=UPI0036CE56C6